MLLRDGVETTSTRPSRRPAGTSPPPRQRAAGTSPARRAPPPRSPKEASTTATKARSPRPPAARSPAARSPKALATNKALEASLTLPFKMEIVRRGDTNNEAWSLHLNALMDGDLCAGFVKQTYVQSEAGATAKFLITAGEDVPSRRGQAHRALRGFILARDDPSRPGFLAVDVLCGKVSGVGLALMDVVEELARREDYHGLSLAALPHVVAYYRRLGFVNAPACREAAAITRRYTSSGAESFVDTHKRNVAEHMDKPEGAKYRAFLQTLINAGLAKDKACSTTTDCAVQGYVMTKCFA